MAAVWLRFRAELRTRWRAWLALALVVGLVGGVVLALVAGARRTDSAYERFLRAQHAYDALIPSTIDVFGDETQRTAIFDTEDLRRLPEVVDTAVSGAFFVSVGAGVGVLVPKNERIGTDINRFKMIDGRRPDPDDPNEAVVSFTYADQYGVEVGDEIQLLDDYVLGEVPPEIPPEEARLLLAARERVLAAVPDNELTIVGIEASPGEFPPQIEGTGRYLVHTSPALYPLRRDIGTFSEAADAVMVRLAQGEDDVDAFLSRLQRLGGGAESSVILQRDLTTPVDRSLRTQAVALYLLALLTALVGALICGQLLARLTFLESSDHRVLSALGMGPGARFGLGMLRAAAIAAAGALVALVVAAALSPAFPVGLARTAEPDPGFDADLTVLAFGPLAVIAVMVALAMWPAWRVGRIASGVEAPRTRPSVTGRVLTERGAPLPVSTGVRMALDPGQGRSSVPVRSSLAGVTIGVATLVAAITFGASLAHLLATPRLYGQSWDVELTTYDSTLVRGGARVLEDDDRIEASAAGNFRVGFDIDGELVDGLVFDRGQSDFSPPILEGRAPLRKREIALGTRTLRSLGVDVGDTVQVGLYTVDREPVSMRVVGRSVFPVFGVTGQLGDGALMSLAGANYVSEDLADPFDRNVLVRLAPDTDVDELVGDLSNRLQTTVFLIDQGEPTDIVNFGRVEATPYILGAILGAISIATLTHLLLSATQRKRRDLAVLKTLGFVRRQVRATVGWQATTLIVVALVVGIPLGVAAGRWIWSLFADELGIINEPQVPLLPVFVLVPIAVAVANLVATAPATIAARTQPAVLLRTE